jgi:hypothetical protein
VVGGSAPSLNVYKRVFGNADNTIQLIIADEVHRDASNAACYWPQSRDIGQKTFAQIRSRPACPTALGASCIEVVGFSNGGSDEILIKWQEGSVILEVKADYLSGLSATTPRSDAEAVAVAEFSRVAAA